jgi:hypothetical protein
VSDVPRRAALEAGIRLPGCGESGESWRQTRGRLTCPACRHQTTATAGTIFDKTRTPLTTWFVAAWYVTNQKYRTSALGLQRVLGLGSYQTAWTHAAQAAPGHGVGYKYSIRGLTERRTTPRNRTAANER